MKIYANELEYHSIVSPEVVAALQMLMIRTLFSDLMLSYLLKEPLKNFLPFWVILMSENVL
jgi:hypothetical protein